MRPHVLHPRCPTYPCRRDVDRRDDLSLIGLGAVSQRPEGGAGIHGAVSVRGATISPYCMDCHCGIAGHGSDAIVPTGHPCDQPGLLAGDCDREVDPGRTVGILDSPP